MTELLDDIRFGLILLADNHPFLLTVFALIVLALALLLGWLIDRRS